MRRARYFAVTVVLGLSACGGDESADVDVEEVERQLVSIVIRQTATPEVQVECPDDVGEGDRCEVSSPGGVVAEVEVTRLTGDGEVEGRVVQP
jgi:hypothetical protein